MNYNLPNPFLPKQSNKDQPLFISSKIVKKEEKENKLLPSLKNLFLDAKKLISVNKSKPMVFPTTSQALSKSTEIAQREASSGMYKNQDTSILNSPLLGELKNKVGLNYQDAQIDAWRQGLKTRNQQLAAQLGNNPAIFNADFTGGIKSVGKNIEKNVIKPSAKNVFQGFKDLSTKLLEDLKGKSTVNKSFIEQRLVSSDLNLKQVEKDLIRSKLANYPERFNVSDFAENIKTDLLPLRINPNYKNSIPNRYESITLPPELRGNVSNYAEHVYESPIKTSAGSIHFDDYRVPNYFGHTRVEDLADSSLDKALRNPGGTRRVIEVQSDLYQKGRLDIERSKYKPTEIQRMPSQKESVYEKIFYDYDENLNPEHYIKKYKLTSDDIASLNKELSKYMSAEKIRGGVSDSKLIKFNNDLVDKLKNINGVKDLSKLEQYNDPTAHYRMVREEVKLAAQDGKTKLQFPTGETAMKIEGLGDFSVWSLNDSAMSNLNKDNLKVGVEIHRGNTQENWIITDVLGDGKFKAVSKDVLERETEEAGYAFDTIKDMNEALDLASGRYESYIEQFDISGKVDTNNPIYKFYEKDLGRYLKSKFNAKQITDPQGVNWFEVDVKPEWANKPVEAFGFTTPEQMLKMGGILGAGTVLGTGLASLLPNNVSEINTAATEEEIKKDLNKVAPINKNKMLEVFRYQESRGEKNPYSFFQYSGRPELGDALGAYQVTEGELETYAKRYLGREVSRDEFLNNPKIQDEYMIGKIRYMEEEMGFTIDEIFGAHRGGIGGRKNKNYSGYINQAVDMYNE